MQELTIGCDFCGAVYSLTLPVDEADPTYCAFCGQWTGDAVNDEDEE